uniref:J domain-containing protein n=1 Tax=Salix viminalis TaxID=40686 RepID=A0A6N2M821_SALVM
MSVSLLPIDHLSMPKAFQIHASYFNPYRTISRLKCSPVRCCDRRREGISVRTKKNYYELLGVSVDSSSQKIKEAYRNLLKKHHPDIAGHKGHEYTLLLNEAYNVLMAEDLRTEYDASIGHMTVQFGTNNYVNVKGSSSWKGPLRPQALFVDENAWLLNHNSLTGCRECVHHANNTFILDKSTGCARVKTQYGDDEQKIEDMMKKLTYRYRIESCPVNCIYWALLEFLTQPQPKQGYGVYGQGWEKPANVFMAAKTLSKQLRQQAEHNHNNGNANNCRGRKPLIQAEARANASLKIKMESFSKIWDSLNGNFWLKQLIWGHFRKYGTFLVMLLCKLL